MKVLIDSKSKSIKISLIESFWSLNQFIRNILEKKWNRQKYIDEIRLGTFKVKLGRKTQNYFKLLDMIPTIIFADSLDSNLLQIGGHFLKKYEIPKCKNCKKWVLSQRKRFIQLFKTYQWKYLHEGDPISWGKSLLDLGNNSYRVITLYMFLQHFGISTAGSDNAV